MSHLVNGRGSTDTEEGFRWECPFCGESRLKPLEGESGKQNAITALRSHIMATDGRRHGPKNAFPDGFERAELTDNVVVEGDGGRRNVNP